MAVQAAQVSVGATETELTGTQTDNVAGQSITALNKGSAVVYLGGTGVTTSTGFELAVGASVALDLGQGEKLYGIVGSGTQTVHVLRVGV